MNPSYSQAGFGAAAADRTRTLFGQVMWYVAATAGVFALGSYLGRDLSHGVAFVAYIAGFACLIGMNFAVRRSAGTDHRAAARLRRSCSGWPWRRP